MGPGLHSATNGNRTDAVYFGGTAVTEETVAWPLEVKPGTRFRYANNDILLAIRGLRATLGEDRYTASLNRILFEEALPEPFSVATQIFRSLIDGVSKIQPPWPSATLPAYHIHLERQRFSISAGSVLVL